MKEQPATSVVGGIGDVGAFSGGSAEPHVGALLMKHKNGAVDRDTVEQTALRTH